MFLLLARLWQMLRAKLPFCGGAHFLAGAPSLPPPLSVNLFTSCRVLGMKVDEAFPDTLYVIGTVALMAILTFTIPGLAEFLPAVLGG